MAVKRSFLLFLFSLPIMAVGACASAPFYIANLPVARENMIARKNIAYGPEAWQRLDLYEPADRKTPSPVLIFLHGGRWTSGTKEQYAFAALPFVRRGYVVVIPDMTKYPDVKFPVFVEDAAMAIAWAYDHAGQYGGSPGQLYVAGHSSGAHVGALAVTDPRYLKTYGKDRSIVRGFAGLAGPYDFTPDESDLIDMFGPPENYPNMQVTTFVDGEEPPMLLLQGAEDDTVRLYNLERLRDAIHEKGGNVETKLYEGVEHIEIMGALSWAWKGKAPVADDMAAFFERHR